jgi:iron complex outermembrane receptor protein
MALASAGVQAQSDTLLGEVSVSAEADPQAARREAPTARIVFHREDLEALDAASVAELLKKLPGTGLFADMESKRGRGKGADRNLPRILVDGEALPGGERSPGAALRLPVDLIERVEIIRNASAEFPAAGPGGTINLILRDVPPKATRGARLGLGVADGKAALRADGQYGNTQDRFGYLWSGALGSRPVQANGTTAIQEFSAGARSAWRLEHDTESGRDDSLSLSPRFSWNLGGGQRLVLSPMLLLSDAARHSDTRRQAYADPLNGAGLAGDGRVSEVDDGQRASGRLAAEWKANRTGWGELSARFTVQGERETKDTARSEYDAADGLFASSEEAERRTETEIGLTLKSLAPLADKHLLGAGLEWRRKRVDETRATTTDGAPDAIAADSAGDQTETRLALWAQDEWQVTDDQLITAGLRWQANAARSTDGLGVTLRRDHQALEPSLHFLWQPVPTWNWRASLALSEKAPGLRDLSGVPRAASGDNASANPDKAGNPALQPESTLGLEAGFEHFLADRAGSLGFNLFLRRIDDQVQKLTQLEAGRWVERPYNVGEAVVVGGMLDYKSRMAAWHLPALTLRGNLSHSRTRLRDTPANLGAGEGPRGAANLGFDYELRERRLTLGGNLNYSTDLKRENTPDLKQTQAARTQLDLYALKKLDKQLALRLSLQNAAGAGKAEDLAEFVAGSLSRLESDRGDGIRTLFLSLEGKW